MDEELDHYAADGRTVADGPHRDVGHDNPNKNPIVHGVTLSRDQRRDLIAFLETLMDQTLRHSPSLSNPWT